MLPKLFANVFLVAKLSWTLCELIFGIAYPLAFPLITIWCLNTLFLLDIPYDWRTILAAWWLCLCVSGVVPRMIYGQKDIGDSPPGRMPYRGGPRSAQPCGSADVLDRCDDPTCCGAD